MNLIFFPRGILHTLCFVFIHLWHTALLPGDVSGPVHQSEWSNMLEKDLPSF